MDMRKLHSFVTVAELNSFIRASEKLHFSQPALSKHVASLEKELGVRLLERDSHSVRLTAAGRALQEGAKDIFDSLKRLQDTVVNIGRQECSLLAVGMPVFHMNSIHSFHQSFKEDYPGLTVKMNYEFGDSVRQLLDRELDILLMRSFEIPIDLLDNGTLLCKNLYKANLRFCVHRSHPLASLTLPQLKNLEGYDLIVLEHILKFNGSLQRYVATKGNLNIPEYLPHSHEEFMHMLFNDRNVGLYEEKTVQPPGDAYKLFDVSGLDLTFYVTAVWRSDNDNALSKNYIDSLNQFIKNYTD